MFKEYLQIATTENLNILRENLGAVFSPETAVSGSPPNPTSAGHCAAVAYVIHEIYGGEYLSTTINGGSHWFNRLKVSGRTVEVDLTADQFGLQPVQIGGPLYSGSRKRQPNELNEETIYRGNLLIAKIASKIFAECATRALHV